MARSESSATQPASPVPNAGQGVSVASFYRFHPVHDVHGLGDAVEATCAERSLRGTVLLAPEGVNATLAGNRDDLVTVIDRHFTGVDVKWSTAALGNPVFRRLKDHLLFYYSAMESTMGLAGRYRLESSGAGRERAG